MRGSVYVASSLHNLRRAVVIMNKFRGHGMTITYDWTIHGQLFDESELRRVAPLEEQGVYNCDLFFLIQPGRNGSHVEFGLAHASKKPIVILEDAELEPTTFYYLDGINRCRDEDRAIALAISIIDGLRR